MLIDVIFTINGRNVEMLIQIVRHPICVDYVRNEFRKSPTVAFANSNHGARYLAHIG